MKLSLLDFLVATNDVTTLITALTPVMEKAFREGRVVTPEEALDALKSLDNKIDALEAEIKVAKK